MQRKDLNAVAIEMQQWPLAEREKHIAEFMQQFWESIVEVKSREKYYAFPVFYGTILEKNVLIFDIIPDSCAVGNGANKKREYTLILNEQTFNNLIDVYVRILSGNPDYSICGHSTKITIGWAPVTHLPIDGKFVMAHRQDFISDLEKLLNNYTLDPYCDVGAFICGRLHVFYLDYLAKKDTPPEPFKLPEIFNMDKHEDSSPKMEVTSRTTIKKEGGFFHRLFVKPFIG